jgi:hypothetical protein
MILRFMAHSQSNAPEHSLCWHGLLLLCLRKNIVVLRKASCKYGDDVDDVEEKGCDENIEALDVFTSDALSCPRTMVVELVNTQSALVAMAC